MYVGGNSSPSGGRVGSARRARDLASASSGHGSSSSSRIVQTLLASPRPWLNQSRIMNWSHGATSALTDVAGMERVARQQLAADHARVRLEQARARARGTSARSGRCGRSASPPGPSPGRRGRCTSRPASARSGSRASNGGTGGASRSARRSCRRGCAGGACCARRSARRARAASRACPSLASGRDARAIGVEDPPRQRVAVAALAAPPSLPVRLRASAAAAAARTPPTTQAPAHRSVLLASRASTVFVPEIAVSRNDVRFDVSPSRPPSAAETVSLAWIGSARRTAWSRRIGIAREQLGADDHRADAEHPPRVERRALRASRSGVPSSRRDEPHRAVEDADRGKGDAGGVAKTTTRRAARAAR